MVHAIIDGVPVEAVEGTTILQAARAAGIDIPTLCYFKGFTSESACRVCVVEVKGTDELKPACSTPIHEGDVIFTENERVVTDRTLTLNLILSHHDTHCFSCPKNDECELQALCNRYGIEHSIFPVDEFEECTDASSRFFTYNPNLCVLCHRCVNICNHLTGAKAIEATRMGGRALIRGVGGTEWADSPCESCGNCVSYCPTGALMPKSRNSFRRRETRAVRTTCTYCGCGCQIDLLVKGDKVVDARPADGPANHGLLCVKGRFAFDFINDKNRLRTPLIRKDGELTEATWDEALDLIASKILEIKATDGPDAIAAFSSARATNEDNYLFTKMMRAAIGTNNIDHCARL